MPREKQKPIYALYALCRYVDDEVVEIENIDEPEAARIVAEIREKLDRVYQAKNLKETRFTVLLALTTYGKILDEIEHQNYNIFATRASSSKTQKILSVPRIWFESKRLRRSE